MWGRSDGKADGLPDGALGRGGAECSGPVWPVAGVLMALADSKGRPV